MGRWMSVPFITADEDVLVERLSGRWTCRANGHMFNEKFNPAEGTMANVISMDPNFINVMTIRLRR